MKQTDDAAVLAAMAALDSAGQRFKQLQIELKAAQDDLGKAHGALHDARLSADKRLPPVKMETRHWSGKTEITDMVVESRTPKSITARYPGLDSGFTFRVDARGEWRQYPRQKGFGSADRTLVGLPRECAVAVTEDGQWFSEVGMDENAATRRAIVRAAAEIGAGMQSQSATEGLPEDNYYKSEAEAQAAAGAEGGL